MQRITRHIINILGILVILSAMAVMPAHASNTSSAERVVAQAAWCGRLSSYTSWYYSDVEHIWKPILYVWKGKGKGNPSGVNISYNGRPVDQSSVQTSTGPQVDPNNGWVGYFIAKRFYLDPRNWQWDDDGRWEVRGCIP